MTSEELIIKAIDTQLSQAKKILEEHGEFYPFACKLDNKGEVEIIAIDIDDENPSPDMLIDFLKNKINWIISEGAASAAAMVANYTIDNPDGSGKVDSIAIEYLDVNGENNSYYYPYSIKKGLFGSRVEYFKPFAVKNG